MKKIAGLLSLIFISIGFLACSGNKKEDPKIAAQAFFEAFASKDFDKAALYATKESKTLIDLLKSLSQMGSGINGGQDIFDEKNISKAIYTNAGIEGDTALVKVSIGSETRNIKMIKEEGQWKVALDKDTLKNTLSEESGTSSKEIGDALNDMEKVSIDSIQSTIKNAEIEISNDTIKKAMEKAGEVLKKTGEALQEASKKN